MEVVMAHLGKLKDAALDDEKVEYLAIADPGQVEEYFERDTHHVRFMSTKLLVRFSAKMPPKIFNLLLDPVFSPTCAPEKMVKALYAEIAHLNEGRYTAEELASFEAAAVTSMMELAKSVSTTDPFDPTLVLRVRSIVCPQCKAYFVFENRCSNAQCRGDVDDEVLVEAEEPKSVEAEEPESEDEANKRFHVFKRWNVASKGFFGSAGVTTSEKNHPILLGRAGDFDEDMQDQFFYMMSHILQSQAKYLVDIFPDNFTLAATIYKVFRFLDIHFQEASCAERAMKIVLWYSNQAPRFAYDLYRFRQVWYIVLQMEANGFDLKRNEPKVFNDVMVMLFYCVDSAKGEINWDMVDLITHKEVTPLLEAYLAKGYAPTTNRG
jgi:hypothetical protein